MFVPPIVDAVRAHVDAADPGSVVGLYLFGSSVQSGLRPDSDIDLLLVTERSLSRVERADLVAFLLRHSGSRATVAPGRPLELTCLVRSDVSPWAYPPMCDFLYGEWLRDQFSNGQVPQRHPNADLAVLVTSVRHRARVLRGPDPGDLLPAVPEQDLRRSIQDSLGPLMDDLVGDERNVLLTLARMLVTLATGAIVPKDEAADRLLPQLSPGDRRILHLAARAYRGEARDDWSTLTEQVQVTASTLAARVRSAA